MKYLIDLSKIILFVAIMYLPLSWMSRLESFETIDKINLNSTVTKLNTVYNATKLSLERQDILEACQRLDAEILAGNIATYTVIGPESSCYKPEGMSALPPITDDNVPTPFAVKDYTLTFIKYTNGPYQWAISVITPEKVSIWTRLKENVAIREEIIKDFVLVIYNVFAFILCAVLIFSESIQNRYRQQGRDPKWLRFLNRMFSFLQLHDIKIIKLATQALIKRNENLEKDIDLLQTSLESSILNEIQKNNKKVPYSFQGTVTKVDINGFSKVVASGHASTIQEMTLRLEDFGCELLQRYKGLFEKTIGDEIVVVFQGADSAFRATAFARDLMHEFSNLEFNIGSDLRQFTLKSSIYSSDITFSKRPSGYGFSGNALTFTTRLMDAVNIKDRNVLSMTEKDSSLIKGLIITPHSTQRFEFKNMSAVEGYLVDTFIALDPRIFEDTQLLLHFRADRHILEMMQNITQPQHRTNILNALLKINVGHIDSSIINLWTELIKLTDQLNFDISQIAKIIILGKSLIPQNQWSSEATQALLSVPRNLDGRINASIIEVLMHHDMNVIEKIDTKTFQIANDASGRTAANILVFKALHRLDSRVLKDFVSMIKSSDPAKVKSGLYGASQVLLHYTKNNPAALETFKEYNELKNIIFRIRSSDKIKISERLLNKLNEIN